MVGIYKVAENLTISTVWVYGPGNAITLPLAEYAAITHLPGNFDPGSNYWEFLNYRLVADFGQKNSFRMQAYHRLDLGLQFHRQKEKHRSTWEIGVYNLYNRKNPFFYYIDSEGFFGSGKRVLKKVSLFPFIPSVSYTIEF